MPSRKFPTGELYEKHKQRYESGDSVRNLADEVGMDVGAYKNRAGFYGWSRLWVTDSNKPRYNKPLKLKSERLVLCDAQIPFHNAGFMNSCINLALAWGIRKALFAGDIFDMTAFAAPKFHTRPSDTFQVELSEGRKFIRVATDLFDETDLLTGNHEKRFRHYMNEQLMADDFRLLLKAPETLRISDYGWCILEDWIVAHPRNVSVIPGRVPVFLSDKFSKYNIASGHGHLQAMSMAKDGSRIVVDIGSCADFSKLDWVALDINTRPVMVTGALILARHSQTGKLIPYPLWEWTDFEALKKMRP